MLHFFWSSSKPTIEMLRLGLHVFLLFPLPSLLKLVHFTWIENSCVCEEWRNSLKLLIKTFQVQIENISNFWTKSNRLVEHFHMHVQNEQVGWSGLHQIAIQRGVNWPFEATQSDWKRFESPQFWRASNRLKLEAIQSASFQIDSNRLKKILQHVSKKSF